MKLVLGRRADRRALVIAAIGCVLGGLAGACVAIVVMVGLPQARIAAVIRAAGEAGAMEACVEGRGRFEGAGGLTYQLFGEDGAALDAPLALTPERRSAMSESREPIIWRADSTYHIGWATQEFESCAYVVTRWERNPRGRGVLFFSLAVAMGVLVLGMFFLVRFWLTKPLLRRLAELRGSALGVGTASYRSARDGDDETSEVAEALDAAHQTALARSQEQAEQHAAFGRFIDEVSHDVRTPIASLFLALDEIAEEASAEAADALDRAIGDVVYLRSLTSNLSIARQMERAQNPRTWQQEVDLEATVERCFRRAQPFALRRDVSLVLRNVAVPTVHGNTVAAEQSITNLIENAIAHGGPNTRVSIGLETGNGAVSITVEDDGPGVDDTVLARLRDGSLGHDEARGRKPMGLGLTITRNICDRAGWRLSAAAVEPHGLKVVIEAPWANADVGGT